MLGEDLQPRRRDSGVTPRGRRGSMSGSNALSESSDRRIHFSEHNDETSSHSRFSGADARTISQHGSSEAAGRQATFARSGRGPNTASASRMGMPDVLEIESLTATRTAMSGQASGVGSAAAAPSGIDSQLLGTNSLVSAAFANSAGMIARVGKDGAVTYVSIADATIFERFRAWLQSLDFSLTVRMAVALVLLAGCGAFIGLFFEMSRRDDLLRDAARHVADAHAEATRGCGLALVEALGDRAARRAAGLTPAAASTSVQSLCSPGAIEAAVNERVRDSIGSFFTYPLSEVEDDDSVEDRVRATVGLYRSRYELLELSLASDGTSVASEADVKEMVLRTTTVLEALGAVLATRYRMKSSRHGGDANIVAVLNGVSTLVGVSEAAVFGAFGTHAAVNLTAGDPPLSTAILVEHQVRPAYIRALRRIRVVVPLTYPGTPLRSSSMPAIPGAVNSITGLADLIQTRADDEAGTGSSQLTVSVLLASGTTSEGRAVQAAGWATQVMGTGLAVSEKPSTVSYVAIVAVVILVYWVLLLATFAFVRVTQRDARKALERQLGQRAVLQHAVAAFVPTRFLSIMGYANITAIEPGDHRIVELTMVFFSVHNYTAVAAGNDPTKMFRLQQNLMNTCVSAARDSSGFIDKFLGDGAFILFDYGLNAVIAAAQMYDASHDLAVRDTKMKGRRGTVTTDAESTASSHASSHGPTREQQLIKLRRKSTASGVMGESMRSDHSYRTSRSSNFDSVDEKSRVHVGIGIHTGEVCVGILGDNQRHSCTLISSKVNLASRLCKLTAKLGVGILLSRDTYESCGHELEEEVGHYLRRFGSTIVYGQKKPTDILELFACDTDEVREYKLATAGRWQEGQEAQSYMNYDESHSVFRGIVDTLREMVPTETVGVDGKPYEDIPLQLNRDLRHKHHVFSEK